MSKKNQERVGTAHGFWHEALTRSSSDRGK